jgi:glycosyltransferase involved in cell wall biosynthesis
VIVSRQSGVCEVLKSAPAVDHWDVQGMADLILELLRSPGRRRTLARRGKRELQSLRWEAAAARLEGVYAELAP